MEQRPPKPPSSSGACRWGAVSSSRRPGRLAFSFSCRALSPASRSSKSLVELAEELLLFAQEGEEETKALAAKVVSLKAKVAKLEDDVTDVKTENMELNKTVDYLAFMVQPPGSAEASDHAEFDC